MSKELYYVLMCHGQAEKIILEKLLNKYKWGNQNHSFLMEVVIPNDNMKINSIDTNNLMDSMIKALSKFFSREEIICKTDKSKYKFIIMIDLDEKNENKEVADAIRNKTLDIKSLELNNDNKYLLQDLEYELFCLWCSKGVETALSEILNRPIVKEKGNKHIHSTVSELDIKKIAKVKLKNSNFNELFDFLNEPNI